MNKRQWKKHLKKKRLEWEATKKYWGIDKWESNIVFQNIADQIINENFKKYNSRDEFINDDSFTDEEKTEICEAIFEAETEREL